MKIAVSLMALAMVALSPWFTVEAGDSGARVLRAGAESITVPLPRLDSLRPVRHGSDNLEYRGGLGQASVDATAEIAGKSMPYQEFAALKVGALRQPSLDTTFDNRPISLNRPQVVEETVDSLIITYNVRSDPSRRDRRDSTPDRVCFGHVYLYARHLILTMVADRDTNGALEKRMQEWVAQVKRANAKGIDPIPFLELPTPDRASIRIPMPAHMDIGGPDANNRFGLRFSDAGNRASATVSAVGNRPMPMNEFQRMIQDINRDYQGRPNAARGQSRDGGDKFNFTDKDRRDFTDSVVVYLKDRPVRFEITVPYGDRRMREWVDDTLDAWVAKASEINRPGWRRPSAFNPMHPGPIRQPAPQPTPGR